MLYLGVQPRAGVDRKDRRLQEARILGFGVPLKWAPSWRVDAEPSYLARDGAVEVRPEPPQAERGAARLQDATRNKGT